MTTATTKSGGDSGGAVGWVGSLAHTPLPEVFRRIVLEERSGDLQVTSSSAIKTVYFDRGFIVFASSNLKSDRLGESMIEAGRISRQDFAVASMLMERGKRKFGQALVQAGILSEEELGHHVATHVNRIVLSLFSVKQGMYSFDERPCIIPLELMVSLSIYRILIEGIRRMKDKKTILIGLPPLETKMRISEAPPFTLDVDKLRRSEKAVIRSVGKGSSLQEITKTIGGNDGLVLRACYGLYAAGVLETGAPGSKSRLRRVQEETGTFKLSEIRRKIEKKRQEVEGTLPSPAMQDGPSKAPVDPERFFERETTPLTHLIQTEEESLPELELELELEPEPRVELEPETKAVEPEPQPSLRPETMLADDSPPPPGVATKEPSPGAPDGGRPAPATEEERPEITWSWSYVVRDFTRWVTSQIVSLFRRLGGGARKPQALGLQEPASPPPREEQPPTIRQEATPPARAQPSTDREVREPPAATPQEKEFAEPKPPEKEPEPPDPGRASSEAIVHPVKAKDLTRETVGIPSWSIKDFPDVPTESSPDPFEEMPEEATEKDALTESLGVPSWSVRDDPGIATKRPPDLHEEAESEPPEQTPANEGLEAPSWSIQHGSTVPDDESIPLAEEEFELEQEPLIELDLEQEAARQPSPPPQVLASMDSDLFVEEELEEGAESSMLSHIAVEEIQFEEENSEFEIEVDEAMFTDLPEVDLDGLSASSVQEELEISQPQELPSRSPVEVESETTEDLPSISYVETELEQPEEPPPISRAQVEPEPTAEEFPSISHVAAEPEPTKSDGERERDDRPASVKATASPILPVPMPVSRPYVEPPLESTTPPPDGDEGTLDSMSELNKEALRIKQGGGEARLLRDVKLHFKFRDWEGAVRLLHQLVQISPGSALYRGMLGRAMSKHPMEANNAEQHFIEALRLSPQDPQLHYWLGLYYKSFGLKSRAYTEFRTTLRIDRNHKGALKQLSEDGKRGDALGGVFKKLFG